MNFLNRCAVRANAGGTDDFVLENAIPGFYTPPLCLNPSVTDGAEYNYFAVSDDGTQHEEGSGVWEVGSSQLFRTTILNSSNGGAKVTFSAAPVVYMGGPAANDMGGTTTSDVLNVTGADELFEIESLRGIRQVNLTAPVAGLYGLQINEFPIPGETVEFVLTDDSDPGAEMSTSERVYVGDAAVVVTLAVGNSVVMQRMEDNKWQVISQNCGISTDEFTTLQGVSLSRVVSMIVEPEDGGTVTPFFPQIILQSNASGAINVLFSPEGVYNPTFIRFAQSDPGDSFIVDPSTFRNLDGSTPSAITFDTDGQCMSIFVYDSTAFVIISASPGVVTP